MSALYLAVRDIAAAFVDGEGEPQSGDGRPALPSAWSAQPIAAPLLAWDIRPPNQEPMVIARVNAVGGRGLYAILGDATYLDSLGAAEVWPGREAWRRALAGEALPRLAMRAWRWWRCDVLERDGQGTPQAHVSVSRELVDGEGVLLPDPGVLGLPWDLDASGTPTTTVLATRRVTTLHRPSLPWTIAGLSMHTQCEAQPDRGM